MGGKNVQLYLCDIGMIKDVLKQPALIYCPANCILVKPQAVAILQFIARMIVKHSKYVTKYVKGSSLRSGAGKKLQLQRNPLQLPGEGPFDYKSGAWGKPR